MKHNRISRQSKAEVARPGDGEYGGGGGDRMNGLRTGGELSLASAVRLRQARTTSAKASLFLSR